MTLQTRHSSSNSPLYAPRPFDYPLSQSAPDSTTKDQLASSLGRLVQFSPDIVKNPASATAAACNAVRRLLRDCGSTMKDTSIGDMESALATLERRVAQPANTDIALALRTVRTGVLPALTPSFQPEAFSLALVRACAFVSSCPAALDPLRGLITSRGTAKIRLATIDTLAQITTAPYPQMTADSEASIAALLADLARHPQPREAFGKCISLIASLSHQAVPKLLQLADEYKHRTLNIHAAPKATEESERCLQKVLRELGCLREHDPIVAVAIQDYPFERRRVAEGLPGRLTGLEGDTRRDALATLLYHSEGGGKMVRSPLGWVTARRALGDFADFVTLRPVLLNFQYERLPGGVSRNWDPAWRELPVLV